VILEVDYTDDVVGPRVESPFGRVLKIRF